MKRNWKCVFGFHPWEKWYDVAEGSVSNLLNQQQNALYQERICEICHKKDRQYILFKKGN